MRGFRESATTRMSHHVNVTHEDPVTRQCALEIAIDLYPAER